jgi:hypothetical protein
LEKEMKKLWALLFVVAAACGAQVPQTPNLKLNLPPHQYPNWDVLLNQNFTVLDTVVGGLQRSYAGTWVAATLYQMSSMVIWNGYSYISLIPNNLNQQPDTNPTAWAVVGYVSGPLVIAPPSGTQASIVLKSTGMPPVVQFQNLSAGPDLKIWTQGNTSDGTYHLSAANDALSTANDAMTCTRTGAVPGACTFPGGVSAPGLTGPPNTLPQYTPTGMGNTQVGVDAATGSYLTANLNNEPYVMSPQWAGGATCDWAGQITPTNANVVYKTTGQLTDTTHFTDANANFTQTDVSDPAHLSLGAKWIIIQGVGPNGSVYGFWSQIASVQDATHITLTTPAAITGSNLSWSYGHDDSAAFNAIDTYVNNLPQGTWPTIHLPPGICMAAVTNWVGQSWEGSHSKIGTHWLCPPGKFCLLAPDGSSFFSQYADVGHLSFHIDETINASCATITRTTDTTPQCLYPNLITGTAGGTNPFGLLAAASGGVAYAVGATIPTSAAGSGCTSPPTVTITDGGPFATLPTATANLSGGTVPNVTLTSIGGKMTKNPTFTFSGGGCATLPQLYNVGTSVAGVAPRSQLNFPAIVTSTATGTIGGVVSVPGLADPPIYAGNGGIAVLRSNGSVGTGPNHAKFHDLVFRPFNGPNAGQSSIAIAMTVFEYNSTYEDIDVSQVMYGILHFPPVTNINNTLASPDTNTYSRINFTQAVWPFAFYDGTHIVMDHVSYYAEAANNMGPMLLGYPNVQRSGVIDAEIRDEFIEGNTANTNEVSRFTGTWFRFYGGGLNQGATNYVVMNTTDATGIQTGLDNAIFYGSKNYFSGVSSNTATMTNMPGGYDNFIQLNANSSFRNNSRTMYLSRYTPPENMYDSSPAVSHSVGAFTSGADLLFTCLENTTLVGTCRYLPQPAPSIGPSTPSPWTYELAAANTAGAFNNTGFPGGIAFPLNIEGRVPQQKVNVRITGRMLDVNDHAGPQRTTWTTSAGASTLGNVYYQATTTQAGSAESPAGPEVLAVGAASKNIVVNSPIDDCPTGATWNLYTSPTSGTEALATSNTPCGTNVTISAIPTGGGTGGPKIVASWNWNAITTPDSVNRGAGGITFNAYWTTGQFTTDLSSAPRGSALTFSTNLYTLVTGLPGYMQISSFQIEPLMSPNITQSFYSVDTGTASAYNANFVPPPTLSAGMSITVKVANTSTGASTLALATGATATAIRKQTSTGLAAIAAGDIVAGQAYVFIYDGTFWQMK